MKPSLDELRLSLAASVRELRLRRRWTQLDLSQHLGLSRARLSQVERGDGSFSAEQLVVILKLFNVSLADLIPLSKGHPDAELQNALARLGAAHLQEQSDLLPVDRDPEVGDVLRETLISASPRLIAALGPVLVQNLDRVNLNRIHGELAAVGLDRRLGWLAENVASALREELTHAPPRIWARRYRRAHLVLTTFLSWASTRAPGLSGEVGPTEVLDPTIRSPQSLTEARAASSAISQRWGIITALQPEDFVQALRAARADH